MSSQTCKIGGVARADFLPRYNNLLRRGLSSGQTNAKGQVCIEVAASLAFHKRDVDLGDISSISENADDAPTCVNHYLSSLKINLNDQGWTSPAARAKGLYDLGIAQIGTSSVKDFERKFNSALEEEVERAIRPEVTIHLARQHKLTLPKTWDEAILLGDNLSDLNNEVNTILSGSNEDLIEHLDTLDRDSSPKTDKFKLLIAAAMVTALVKVKAPGVKWLPGARKVAPLKVRAPKISKRR